MLQRPFIAFTLSLIKGAWMIQSVQQHDLFSFIFSALAMHVKPCLEKLSQDGDHDVQHFANEALESK